MTYSQLINVIEKYSEKALENAVKVAVEEKPRYTAECNVKTESARAWLDRYLKNMEIMKELWLINGNYLVGTLFLIFVICTGWERGFFQKIKFPICQFIHIVFVIFRLFINLNLKDKKQKENIQEAGNKWLKSLSKQEQYKVLGIDGLKAWKNGTDWRNYARNYSTDYAKTRLKDLNIKSENDIIKEKISFKMKELKIKHQKVNYPPKDININGLDFDDNHINNERHHNVSEKEAIQLIQKANFSFTKYNGHCEIYCSVYGWVYILDSKIRTVFKTAEFDDKTKSFMNYLEEVLKNES